MTEGRARRWVALAALFLAALAPTGRAQQAMVELSTTRLNDGARQAVVRNTLAGPVSVRVWAPAQPEATVTATLDAGETRALGRFSGDDEGALRLDAQPGAPLLLPPEQRGAYDFPLSPDAEWRLTQGFGGRASHRDAAKWYAIDLAAAAGTPVRAARAGTVMQVVDAFRESGTDARLKDRSNLIRVLHTDGSMAVYAHIAHGSARVRTGDAVSAGTPLAAVGSVGWSTAPHLHFSVQVNDGRELLSLPFRMVGPEGRPLDAAYTSRLP